MSDEIKPPVKVHILTNERIPGILALVLITGVLGLVVLLAFHPVPQQSHDILLTMLGSLSASLAGVIGYYFGSSKGSEKKDAVLAGMKSSQPPNEG